MSTATTSPEDLGLMSEEPTPTNSPQGGLWLKRVKAVVEDPNDWKTAGPYSNASVSRSAKRAFESLVSDRPNLEDEGEFEVTTRTKDDGVYCYMIFHTEE